MPWGKKWPVQMNLPFFAVKAYVPGGVQNQAEFEKCLPAGTGQKFTFPAGVRDGHRNRESQKSLRFRRAKMQSQYY